MLVIIIKKAPLVSLESKGGVNFLSMNSSEPLEIKKKEYKKLVQMVKPKPTLLKNGLMAFLVGGAICTVGQLLLDFFTAKGLGNHDAGFVTSAILVFVAAFLTGLGVYDSAAKHAGAGMIIPITGFANSMVAPAMEFRSEGMIMGVGARLFTIAGPVLVFGIVAAWLVGFIAYIISL